MKVECPLEFAHRVVIRLIEGGWNFESILQTPLWALSDWLRDHGDDVAAEYLRYSEETAGSGRHIDGFNRVFELVRYCETQGRSFKFRVRTNRGWGFSVTNCSECPTFAAYCDADVYAAMRQEGMSHWEAWQTLLSRFPGVQYRN